MNIIKDKKLRKTVSELAEKLGYDVSPDGDLIKEPDGYFGYSIFLSSDSGAGNRIETIKQNKVARKIDVESLEKRLDDLRVRMDVLVDHLNLQFDYTSKVKIERKPKQNKKTNEGSSCC